MQRAILALLLVSLFVRISWAEEYSFSLNGQSIRPPVVRLADSPAAYQPGDVIEVANLPMVLGPPGTYAFELRRGVFGTLFLSLDGEPSRPVAVTLFRDDDTSQVRNPLAQLAPTELQQIRGVVLDCWRPEFATDLERLDLARCCITLTDCYDASRDGPISLPNLPPRLRYLFIRESSNMGYGELSGLSRLSELRLLSLDLLTAETTDAGWVSGCRQLNTLLCSNLVNPERLVGLDQLAWLRAERSDLGDGQFLARLPGLSVVQVRASRLTDLSALAGHPRVRRVVADLCPVERLPASKVPELAELSLLGSSVPLDQLQAFEQANPDCRVHHDWANELRNAVTRANRLRVRSGGTCHRDPANEATLFESREASDLAGLLEGIEIDSSQSGVACMCCGTPSLEFYQDDTLLQTVGFHHGELLRWSAGWPGDAVLTADASRFLVDWLDLHGVPGPKLEIEESTRRQRRFAESLADATEGLPKIVKEALIQGDDPLSLGASDQLKQALDRALPEPEEQVLALFQVLGSAGPWNPSSMFEAKAEGTLKTFPDEVLRACVAQALAGSKARQARGAVRFWTRSELGEWPGTDQLQEQALTLLEQSPSAWTRQHAVFVLSRWSRRGANLDPHLAIALSDPDEQVRRAAIRAAGQNQRRSLASPLLALVKGQPAPPRKAVATPAYDYPEPIGRDCSEPELAGIALGLMEDTAAREAILATSPSPAREVALALLGEPERLKPEFFRAQDRDSELPLAAIEVVVRCAGRHGLGWALDENADYGWRDEEAFESLHEMLLAQNPPAADTLHRCESLDQLKSWYANHGAGYRRTRDQHQR
ncbi:MAG: HEAT repeat domain-containing protein [Vulcanimicrobiota bacterium]